MRDAALYTNAVLMAWCSAAAGCAAWSSVDGRDGVGGTGPLGTGLSVRCRLQGPNGSGSCVRLAKWPTKSGVVPFQCGKTDVFKFDYEDCGGFGIAQAWPCSHALGGTLSARGTAAGPAWQGEARSCERAWSELPTGECADRFH
jgi:hypothetical protein